MAKLYQGQPGTSDALLFTAERRYTHLTILCANTTGTDATIRLNFCYQGASAAANNEIVPDVTIPANRTGLIEMGLVIERGDTMRALQGASNAITVTIDGLDIGKDSHSRGSSFSFFPPASGGGGGSSTNFWAYDGSTLQPDPATTTPLDHFVVATDGDFSLAAHDGTTNYAVRAQSDQMYVEGINVADPTVFGRLHAGAPSGASGEFAGIAQAGGFTAAVQADVNNSTQLSLLNANAQTATRTAALAFSADDSGASVGVLMSADDGVTNTSVGVSDTQITLGGKIGTDQSASATIAVGTLSHKIPIYDNSGTLLGYLPVYASIT